MDTEEPVVMTAGLASRLDKLAAQIGAEIAALLPELTKLQREPLDLRARQRLKRTEQSAKRILKLLKEAFEPQADPKRMDAVDKEQHPPASPAEIPEDSLGGPETADELDGQGG